MRFDLITLFPEIFHAITDWGVTGRAFQTGHAQIHYHNPRDYTESKHGNVDDRPYGGGPGMVMQVQPLRSAIQAAKAASPLSGPVIYMSPQGAKLTQQQLHELLAHPRLIILNGRYEGIDQRIIDNDIDLEISLGDFVLSGGEYASLCLIDALVRLLPGVLGCNESLTSESFAQGLLDYPHYTRPECIDGQSVPEVLLKGNHAEIARFRFEQQLLQTYWKRRDLLVQYPLNPADQRWLDENRLLSKLAVPVESEEKRSAEPECTQVHEDSGTASTKPFAGTVGFRKKSNLRSHENE